MKDENEISVKKSERKAQVLIGLVFAVAMIYLFSNPKPQNYYDYTFRVAENFLRGGIGFTEQTPSWLNEFVPFEGKWYSVFPLGGVLTMIPFAFLKLIGIITEMPAALISALSAGAICIFLIFIANKYKLDFSKKILLILAVLFGTWMWTNLTFGGAWQLALGFAMIGELGAIYFTIYNRKPLLAGFFFALAFGNRTENLLTAPIFLWIIYSYQLSDTSYRFGETEELKANLKSKNKKKQKQSEKLKPDHSNLKPLITDLAKFCAFPAILGVLTLSYNYVRFHSLTDFGYARIPGVLKEPWYYDGIFSLKYIPNQCYEMLFRLWETKPNFPYLVPNGFSSSILWSSPFLFLVFRCESRHKALKYAAWTAIFILTFLLWIHGNSGGWQFGYRYAMILLPWLFVILLENSPKNITRAEWILYGFSFLMNFYAVYLFHWTEYVKP